MKNLVLIGLVFILTYSNAQNLADDIYDIQAEHNLMGGVVTLVCENDYYQTVPFGFSDYDRQIWADEETMYRIASVSKSVTAVALMQLVEQDLIELDEDVSSYLGFDLVNPNVPFMAITARQLLSHTSTIVDGSGYAGFLSATYNQNPIPPLSELLDAEGSYYTSDMFNNNTPGNYFNYSNINCNYLAANLVTKFSPSNVFTSSLKIFLLFFLAVEINPSIRA